MNMNLLVALTSFAFVTSVSPGPNNIMLMASGANFGLRRTLPHWLGVSAGFVFMASALGIGFARIFENYPQAKYWLQIVSAIYLLWLAWKIATTAKPGEGTEKGRPLTFLQAVAFQWVNPKVWAMALTMISLYVPDGSVYQTFTAALIFGFVNFPSVGLWAVIGRHLQNFLQEGRRLRIFNVTLAIILAVSLAPLVMF